MSETRNIEDPTEFYENRFAFRQAFDFLSRPVDFFDINNFKAFWIFSKVAPNSLVLDLGCGSGRLACLKAKGCRLTGIDFSASALAIAQELNGYDAVFQGDVLNYGEQAGKFDHVVSLDVFGHIPFTDKDKVIGHLKRLLKPGGSMLHGIECGHMDYTALSPEQWERIVKTDGHIGIESKRAVLDRFRRFFEHVRGEVRFDVVAGVSDYIKYDTMFPGELDPDLLRYMRCMDPCEKKAFDLSAGLTLIKMENNQIQSNDNAEGFLLLQASDRPLPNQAMTPSPRVADRDRIAMTDGAVFLKGWYEPEQTEQGMFRWARRRAYLALKDCRTRRLRLSLFTSYPLIQKKPVDLYIISKENDRVLATTTLSDTNCADVTVSLDNETMTLEIFTDVAWVPKLFGVGNDDRELAFGIRAIELV
ncbi:MAG: hypothetical protein AUK55_11565 [Syntrophobacteraceae bacterium CG2_30_61_12]|nr:MAG: hypothetical protein AUK55_11565 [Syntrophobacteraceae bacterium CG2_30_61_12]